MPTDQTGQTYTLFVGVDIAAQTAMVATQRPGAKASRSFTIEQTPEGYTSLLHQLGVQAIDVIKSEKSIG